PGFAGLGVHPPPPARTGLGPPCCRAVVRPVAASPWRAACRSLWAVLGAGRSLAVAYRPLRRTRLFSASCAVLSRCALSARAGPPPVGAAQPGKRSAPVGRAACRARAEPLRSAIRAIHSKALDRAVTR